MFSARPGNFRDGRSIKAKVEMNLGLEKGITMRVGIVVVVFVVVTNPLLGFLGLTAP